MVETATILFKTVSMEDKEWIKEALKQSDNRGNEFTFGNIYCWSIFMNYKIARLDGFFACSYKVNDKLYFAFPKGHGDLKQAIERLRSYAYEQNQPFVLSSLVPADMESLDLLFPGQFQYKKNEVFFDYVYETEALANLSGKKYHSKRNHIARFEQDNPDWVFELMTEENMAECIEMNREWCKQNDCAQNKSKKEESCVVKRALDHFFELGYVGGLIRVKGKVIAFSMGEMVNSDTFVTHIEKAFGEIQGAYAIINREFSRYIQKLYGCKYINREDDAGSEGLRKAKMSYKPVFLHERYFASESGRS